MGKKTLIEKAFETFDSELLVQALQAGEDLNAKDKFGSALWYNALDDYVHYHKGRWTQKKSRIKKFLTIAVQHGLDLNSYEANTGGDGNISHFYSTVRYSCNHDLKFLQFIIDLGVDLNGISSTCEEELDSIFEFIPIEKEIGHSAESAKWYYDAARLLIKNGAKVCRVLHPEDEDFWEKPEDITPDNIKQEILASRLDCAALEKLSPDRIIFQCLDLCALELSSYYFPHEFYAHTKAFQKRIINYLQVVINKIGLQNLWDCLLSSCIELQYCDVMEFLLDAGVDPNINCFNADYSFVSSSALYTLKRSGYLLPEDIREHMEKLLLDHGAILTKKVNSN